MSKKIIYQVLPRLWGRGKFSDWDDRSLSYVKSLSVDYIWFTGVPRHASGEDFVKGTPGSPYSVSDWFDVNPYLADKPERRMKEFAALVQRVHSSGMKVMVDFIPNHVACNYRGDIPVLNHCDYDWTDTRKIDYGSAATVPALRDVLMFWAQMGVDGFRCDMVELVPREALKELISSVKAGYPDMLFVAEVYEKGNYRDYLERVGFDLLYDKSGIYDSLRRILCSGGDVRELTGNWQFLGDMQPKMLCFLENHDEQRLASGCFAGSAQRGYAAAGAAALFSEASFMLYFGQELGEDASNGACGRTSIFDFTDVGSVSRLLSSSLRSVEKQILSRYRKLLEAASSPVFSDGERWDLCYCQNGGAFDFSRHFAFVRYNKRCARLVFCNFSPEAADLDVVVPEELSRLLPGKCSRGGEMFRINVNVSPFDYVVKSL